MSFLTGSASFQRFRVTGPKPRLFDDQHLERLRGEAAGRDRVATADGVERGWTAGRHIFDTDFTQEKNVYADHLLFDFRTQMDRLPGDRLKAYYEVELKALAKDNPSGFASAKQKRAAKEAARDRIEQEARDGRYRKWKCVPCAWDAVTNTLFYGAAVSSSAATWLTEKWDATFGGTLFTQPPAEPVAVLAGKLEAVTASSLALALYPGAKDEHLSAFVSGADAARTIDAPCWCPVDGVPDFLGNEFLLWLWYVSDVESDTVKTPDGAEVTFMFSGGIKVEDPRGETGNCTANSASAVRLPEAKAAVRGGKLPREAALTVVRNSDQFSFKIKAETLAVTGARLPAAEDKEAPRDRELARLQHLRDLSEIIDQLFAAFLARRMSAYWSQEVKEISAWLKGGKVRA